MIPSETQVVDDVDDIEYHAVDCLCDECIDGLIAERNEDRAA